MQRIHRVDGESRGIGRAKKSDLGACQPIRHVYGGLFATRQRSNYNAVLLVSLADNGVVIWVPDMFPDVPRLGGKRIVIDKGTISLPLPQHSVEAMHDRSVNVYDCPQNVGTFQGRKCRLQASSCG